MIIPTSDKSIGYQFSIEKGGPGSGPRPHNGSGGKDARSQRTFESMSLPLRSKLKLDDEVLFLDKDNKVHRGQVTHDERAGKDTIAVRLLANNEIVLIPKVHLRMPKGGYRTRG